MTKATLSSDELSRYVGIRMRNPAAADRYWARCMGRAQDSSMDEDTVAQIKEFLSSKLSHEDHSKVCSMMDGGGAQDTEPPPGDPDVPPRGQLAGDAKADFNRRFPDAARIRLDNSGIPVPRRPAKPCVVMDTVGVKSFATRYPDAMKIRLA